MSNARIDFIGSGRYGRNFNIENDQTVIGINGDVKLPEDDIIEYIAKYPGCDKNTVKYKMHNLFGQAVIIREGSKFSLVDKNSLFRIYVNCVKIGNKNNNYWKSIIGDPTDSVDKLNTKNDKMNSVELKSGDIISVGREVFGSSYVWIFNLKP